MSKIKTPDWVLKAKKKADKKKTKDKKFSVKICPNCKSRDVGVVIGGQIGMWECHKCNHRGAGFLEMEMNEEEFMKYLDKEAKDKLEEK